jgi:hypothetical protein
VSTDDALSESRLGNALGPGDDNSDYQPAPLPAPMITATPKVDGDADAMKLTR